MDLLILQMLKLIAPAGYTATQVNTVPSDNIGFVVIGIIVAPVLLLALIGSFEYPRKSKVPELFLGGFLLIVSTLVISLALISFVLKFVIPQ